MMSINTKKHYATGFTLIELLIAVTILGVLIALSVPSFENFIQKRRVQSASETMFNFIKLARSEAIKQNTNVLFYIDTSNSCYAMDDDLSTDCDCDNLANCTLDGEQKWKDSSEDFKDIAITLKAVAVDSDDEIVSEESFNPMSISFSSNGFANNMNENGRNKSILLFEAVDRTYNLGINMVGRIKLKQE